VGQLIAQGEEVELAARIGRALAARRRRLGLRCSGARISLGPGIQTRMRSAPSSEEFGVAQRTEGR